MSETSLRCSPAKNDARVALPPLAWRALRHRLVSEPGLVADCVVARCLGRCCRCSNGARLAMMEGKKERTQMRPFSLGRVNGTISPGSIPPTSALARLVCFVLRPCYSRGLRGWRVYTASACTAVVFRYASVAYEGSRSAKGSSPNSCMSCVGFSIEREKTTELSDGRLSKPREGKVIVMRPHDNSASSPRYSLDTICRSHFCRKDERKRLFSSVDPALGEFSCSSASVLDINGALLGMALPVVHPSASPAASADRFFTVRSADTPSCDRPCRLRASDCREPKGLRRDPPRSQKGRPSRCDDLRGVSIFGPDSPPRKQFCLRCSF
ncbi:hypothetical protein HPB51_011685 [Rhipicephalus microplus]|uniref:Uncharacterized protein n=1 Tax=Rhipicephalus microplus TaxID=6941 RepID=A0A9J6DN28_RHIMP|nr:hypothetical protein HPB51_011685 [Rhipicephalus microplus]